MKRLLAALIIVLVPSLALAQSAVRQSGSVNPNDVTKWDQTGIIKSGGGLNGDNTGTGVNPFAINDKNGLGLCFNNAQALTSANNPFCFGHDNNGNPISSVGGTEIPITGTVTGLPQAATNAALQLLATSTYSTVMRTGFAAPGDSPAILYVASTSACSLNGGNGDNGWQIKSADGHCWIASFPANGAPLQAWGACLGGANDSTAINAAITANPVGVLLLPGGGKICTITSPVTISVNNITLAGGGAANPNQGINTSSSTLACRTGTTDCIRVIASAGANVAPSGRVSNVTLRDFLIDATGQTGSNAVSVQGAQFVHIDRVPMFNPYGGLYVWNVYWVRYAESFVLSPKSWGVKFDTDPAIGRGDLLTLDQVQIACAYAGGEGIMLDGFVQTVYMTKGGATDCLNDLHIQNSRGSTTSFAQHIYASDWAGDGATTHAIWIAGGSDMHFSHLTLDNATGRSGQGGADSSIVQIDPDTGKSNTNSIFFNGPNISDGHAGCFVTGGIYVSVSNPLMNNCGVSAPVNTVDYFTFGASARDSTITGGTIGDTNARYNIDSGAVSGAHLYVRGVNLVASVGTAAIYDPNLSISGQGTFDFGTTVGAQIAAGATAYLGPQGSSPTPQLNPFVTPSSGSIYGIVIQASNTPTSGTVAWTIYNNGVTTPLAATWGNGAFGATLTGFKYSFNPSDNLEVRITNPATGTPINVRGQLLTTQ